MSDAAHDDFDAAPGDVLLTGVRVLVTGASSGIGAATARLLGRLGAHVVVHHRSGVDEAKQIVEAIRADAGRADAIAADLSRWPDAVRAVDDALDAMGGLDALVCNHGVWKPAPIAAMTEAQYDETFDANLRGIFALTGAATRAFARAKTGGSIVLVASTAAQRGEARYSHYAASKGAIVSLTKSLAVELAPSHVRVNCVAPGWVHTRMTAGALSDAHLAAQIHASIPAGRVGRPAEIAWAIAFLLGDACPFATGEVLNVNGGAVLCG